MTELYRCDKCGQIFEDEDTAKECEYSHRLEEYENQIHIFNRDNQILDIKQVEIDTIYLVACESEEAAQGFYDWWESVSCADNPYEDYFGRKKVTYYGSPMAYDEENDYWFELDERIDAKEAELEELKEKRIAIYNTTK